MKIIVATKQTQGQRTDDFCYAREGEIVLLSDDCDELHAGCNCHCSMVGAETGKGTTTMQVVESQMTRAAFVAAVRAGELRAGFDDLLSERAFEAEAGELLRLAAQFPVGAIIERDGDKFNVRA